MMNPLFSMLGGGNQFQNTPFGNVANLIQSLNQFRQNFNGNPQQQIQQLLNSGRISQEQYNDAFQKAQQIQRMLNGRF